MSSSFKDLKESDEKAKERNWQIYFDWQHTKRKADMFVSFVIYTKHWIIAVIVLTVIFSMGLPFDNQGTIYSDTNRAYTFQTDLAEKHMTNQLWSGIIYLLSYKQMNMQGYLSCIMKQIVTKIVEKLEQFEKQEISLIFDNTLKKNEIKIIFGELIWQNNLRKHILSNYVAMNGTEMLVKGTVDTASNEISDPDEFRIECKGTYSVNRKC